MTESGKGRRKRKDLLIKMSVHWQATQFFEHLKDKLDDSLLLTFDIQKKPCFVQSDQSAYYSRQLYCHKLTVVTGTSKDKVTPENVSIYTWTENETRKSSIK